MPNLARVWAASWSISAGCAASAGQISTGCAAPASSCCKLRKRSSRRAEAITRAPSPANRSAAARPIPLDAPTMSTAWSANETGMFWATRFSIAYCHGRLRRIALEREADVTKAIVILELQMAAIPLPPFTVGSHRSRPPSPHVVKSRWQTHRNVNESFIANTAKNIIAILFGHEGFILREPLTLRVYQRGSFWINEYKPLGIVAHGRTKREVLKAFSQELSSCWHWIALEDERLEPDALELKRKLKLVVAAVKPTREVLSRFHQS